MFLIRKYYCGALVVLVSIINSSELLQCGKRLSRLEEIGFCKNPDRVTVLDLKNKPINNIIREDTFRKYTSVTNLYLSGTNLTDITWSMFRGMNSLKNLYLSNNRLESLNNNSFGEMGTLMQLFLNNNVISNIEQGSFKQLPKLMNIYIKNNTLTIVDKDIFSENNNVRHLDFAGNFLKDISFIYNLINVEVLDFPSNKIETLESNTFQNLKNLVYIDLKHNLIKELPINLFVDQTKLKQVDLSHNQLVQIETGTFGIGFRDLLLNDNKITKIGVLSDISEINLSRNLLKELPVLPKNLKELIINENPWNCKFIYMLTDLPGIHLNFTTANGEKNVQGVPCEDMSENWITREITREISKDERKAVSFWNTWIIVTVVVCSILPLLLLITIYLSYKKGMRNRLERSFSRTSYGQKRLSNFDNWRATGTENGYLTPVTRTENFYEEIY